MKKKRTVIRMAVLLLLMSILTAACGKNEKDSIEETSEAAFVETAAVQEEHSMKPAEEVILSPEEQRLAALQEKADNVKNILITIPFGDKTEVINSETVKDWVTVGDDLSVSVDAAAVREYVNGLSRAYDTFGLSRQFRTHDGGTVTVSGGDYGWWMDRPTTAEALTEKIANGESGEFTPVYFGTAVAYGDNDIGNTYVEIDIGSQHLYVYRDGQMMKESDFVSGALMKGNGTPCGTYAITYKERDATLVGENYSSSVAYWMPFNGNIGMHDASWRDNFGGHIYYMSGSHGCINLPTEAAAEIFDIVVKGEPVVVYGAITKEEAVERMTAEEKEKAMEKGYIPMSEEMKEKKAQEQLEKQMQEMLALQALQAAQAAQEAASEGEGN